MNKKRLTISLIATVVSVVVNFGISFFLTPFVVKKLGTEAYGFSTLANNFINYAQILTVALNSMAGRYITIAYHKGNKQDAQAYYSSTFFANVILNIILIIPTTFFVIYLDKIINIEPGQIADVKILFTMVFMSFGITLLFTAFATSTFISNRKDLEAKRNIEAHIIKAIILFALFAFLQPHVYFIGIASLVSNLYLLVTNIRYSRMLIPDIRISNHSYSRTIIKLLVKSGVWNSINRMGTVLGDGLDLLIANMFISPTTMGVLALAKQIPSVISTMISTVGGVFAPNYTIAYAKNDKSDLLNKIRQSMLILGLLSNLCLTVLISVGQAFFRLWIPNQDAILLQQLSVMTIVGLAINGGLQCIFNIFTVTNKIKANALVTLGSNVINIIVVLVLLKNTDLGVFAVAGVSTVITIFRNLLFSIPYAAKCIDIDNRIFYKPVIIKLIALIICSMVGLILTEHVIIDTWPKLLLLSIIIAALTIVINTVITTTTSEKKKLWHKIISRVRNLKRQK